MSELKTLKDIFIISEGVLIKKKYFATDRSIEYNKAILKQEAIKDIKELQKIEEIDMTEIPVEEKIRIEEKYFTLFDAVGAYDNSNVIDYIRWKFNITEEDLKDD